MVDIDTKNSQSILFTAGNILIKCFYLKKTREYFLYYIDSEGLLPIKKNNVYQMSKIIMDNLPQTDVDVQIRYSSLTSRKKKNQIQHLITQKDGINISFSNILNCLKLIS
jgi:hypothetical protein